MNAIISGRAEIALWEENGTLFRLPWGAEQPVKCTPAPLGFFFGDATDLQFLSNLTLDETRRKLDEAVNCADALHGALMALDPELSFELRIEVSDTLNELLAVGTVCDYVRGVLFARPLTADSDIEGALRAARAAEAKPLFEFWQSVRTFQPIIEQVWLAWQALDDALFRPPVERDELRAKLVGAGQFAALVKAVHDKKIGDFFITISLNREFKPHQQIIRQWTEPFRNTTSRALALVPDDDAQWAAYDEKTRTEPIHAVFTRIEKQKAAIVEAMRARNWRRVEDYIAALVRDHLVSDASEDFVVKSLCDLAMEAKSLGLHHLQLQLTEQSLRLNPNDVQVYTQNADALLLLGRLDEALPAYERTIALFPQNEVARCGRAEVLKALGRLDEALVAYEETIANFPTDVFPKNGRAEVLKALGRLDEALVAYEETIAQFPHDEVARCGRAEVFKSQGRLNEALVAYEQAMAQFTQDEVARCGRAEVLKALGRLDNALSAYEQTIAQFPHNEVARNGWALVLVALGRAEEALDSLPSARHITRQDWITYHIRGMVLLAAGRVEEAIGLFQHGVNECPFVESRNYFRSALAMACLRKRQFDKVVETLEAEAAPETRFATNVLLVHAHGELNERQKAQAAYDDLMNLKTFRPSGFSDLTDELHHRYLNGTTSQHDDAWVFQREFDLVAATL
jgi:tetratricopeptide (TPR) repeat protein